MPGFAESLQLMESWVDSKSLRRHVRLTEVACKARAMQAESELLGL